jgi:flagellin
VLIAERKVTIPNSKTRKTNCTKNQINKNPKHSIGEGSPKNIQTWRFEMATVDITRIASNIGALNALNSLQSINSKLATHQTRLSTGLRIKSASDDPAGLTIATKMLARSEGLKTALDNISDAKNMLSVAEGGMSKMSDIIVQMRNKAEQAASDTLGTSERAAIQTQLSSYAQQLQDIIDQTKWNNVKLLDNTTGNKVFQTGVEEGETTTWTLP